MLERLYHSYHNTNVALLIVTKYKAMVLPDQKVAFMINRTVTSCEAIKFKSNYQRRNYITLCSTPKTRIIYKTSGGYQSLSSILHSCLVGVASSLSHKFFFYMRVCRSLSRRIVHPASISKTLDPARSHCTHGQNNCTFKHFEAN